MKHTYKEACAEVYYILQHMEETLINKISPKMLEIIKKNRAKDYSVNIDINKPLKEQSIKDETKAILSIIYKKFWNNEACI